MPKFSQLSKSKLSTAHPDLQRLFNEVIKTMDCTVICGHRDKNAQDKAVKAGNSRTPWPTSKHNSMPSMAVDVAPWQTGGIDWANLDNFKKLGAFVEETAKKLNIKISWGGRWKSWQDWSHYELK